MPQVPLYLNLAVGIPIAVILYAVGVLLYFFYAQYPESLSGLPLADGVLPYFVVQELPHGLTGIVIAAILAAAMSTMSSGINSLSTVSVVDFYKRLWRPLQSESHYLRAARFFSLMWGILGTAFALFAKNLGELAVASAKVNSFLGGIVPGVFLLGMLSQRGRSKGAVAGGLIGLAAVTAIGVLTTISWMWYAMIGCLITLSCGYVLSLRLQQLRNFANSPRAFLFAENDESDSLE